MKLEFYLLINSIELFYNSIIPYLIPLIKDPFGNYFIQKLFNYLKEDQIKNILLKISRHLLRN